MLEVCEVLHELSSCTDLPVLDYSDTCFREELRRSDPINQVRVYRPTSGQWSRSTENWTSTLREFHQHVLRDIVPDSLWTVLFDGVPLFLRTGTNE